MTSDYPQTPGQAPYGQTSTLAVVSLVMGIVSWIALR